MFISWIVYHTSCARRTLICTIRTYPTKLYILSSLSFTLANPGATRQQKRLDSIHLITCNCNPKYSSNKFNASSPNGKPEADRSSIPPQSSPELFLEPEKDVESAVNLVSQSEGFVFLMIWWFSPIFNFEISMGLGFLGRQSLHFVWVLLIWYGFWLIWYGFCWFFFLFSEKLQILNGFWLDS